MDPCSAPRCVSALPVPRVASRFDVNVAGAHPFEESGAGRKTGRCDMFHLKSTGLPVGISADWQFAPTTFQLAVDDVLVAYTDGITEAQNYHEELWGEEKLEKLLRTCSGATSEQVIERILDEVSALANGQPQRDNMTLVVMTVQEGCDLE